MEKPLNPLLAPLTPPLSLHPNTQRGPTKRISQTSVCIVACSYAEWQGFGYFVGCEGPLENFYWVSMVMRVKEHSTFLQRRVWVLVCVCVSGRGYFLKKQKSRCWYPASHYFLLSLLLLLFCCSCINILTQVQNIQVCRIEWWNHLDVGKLS